MKKLLLLAMIAIGAYAQPISTTYWNGLYWDTGPTAPTNCYYPGVFYQTSGTAQLMICDMKANGYIAIPKAVSGVFTTPNLGTPSAINLANATNLPSSAAPVVKVVDSAITATSLSTEAICALHTDTPDGVHACSNSVTDATAANCPAGTLTASCTFPISLTVPAGALGSSASQLTLSFGRLATATIPTSLIEVYLDSTRIYAGTAVAFGTGAGAVATVCSITVQSSSTTAPISMSCTGAGSLQINQIMSSNNLLTNTAPGIAVDTTISHVLKVSIAYSANTTGNSAWLYGMRLAY